MANNSRSEVAATFHLFLIQIQALLLLFSFVKSDEAVCGNFCPPVGSIAGWETQCRRQQSSFNCGDSDVRDIPSAPSDLQVDDFIHEVGNVRLLAMNITWRLPVTGNFTGLQGFYVNVIKTSYPVGFNECNGIHFDHPLTVSSFASEVVFQFSCLRNVDVDSTYNIEITSIGSKKTNKIEDYQTSNCAAVPGVGGCPLDNVPPDEWKPSQLPTVGVTANTVTVTFSIYPLDRWITYKINLRPCNGQPTPSALHRIVDTKGASGSYFFPFQNVPPGCYKAHVSLYQKQDGTFVDGYDFVSEPFRVRPEEPTTSADPNENTGLSAVSGMSVNPEDGPIADPSDDTATKPVLKTSLITGIIGGVIGVAVALILLLTFVIKQKCTSKIPSELVSSQETPGDCLVNNMVQNDLTGPGCLEVQGYGDSVSEFQGECPQFCNHGVAVTGPGYLEAQGYGDSVSEFQGECPQFCNHGGFPYNAEDFRSVTNMSGVTV